MFDNVKNTIAVAEEILSDLHWNKSSASESVIYWNDKLGEFKTEHPDEDASYYLSGLSKAQISVQMYDAIEETVVSFVRKALK